MQIKQSLYLALASVAGAQTPGLNDALQSQNSSLSSFISLLNSTGNSQALSNAQNITILAPNNDAISYALNNTGLGQISNDSISALLQYHVLNGTYYASNITNTSMFIPTYLTNQTFSNVTGGQVVEAIQNNGNVSFYSALKQNVSIVTPNVNFTGGTIHIIDGLLAIPGNVSNTLSDANLTAADGAISTTNLTPNITSASDITIFAPNNDAFNTVGSIFSNLTSGQVAKIITYHVVNGTVAYSNNITNETLTAMDGQNINLTNINGTIFANGARVTVPDILLDNGVLHVVDQVLNPSNTSLGNPDTSATTAPPAYSSASSGTGIPFTSGVTTPTTTFPAATSAPVGSTSTKGIAVPMKTGAVGAAALFGGAAIFVNL
ncbi:FAS1 domain-containing protein [Xylariaceae sp. FL0255]|nr:FAS1 domain-containing protein [Xylariaceae sp. FL0255]